MVTDDARALIADIPTPAVPVWSRDSAALAWLWDEGDGWDVWVADGAGQGSRVVARGAALSGIDWTPAGEVMFTRRTTAGTLIAAADPQTGAVRDLTTGPGDRAARCSPDGTTVAFLSTRAGSVDVWTVPATGGAVTQLTEQTNPLDEPRWSPVWSPDGQWIAYVSSRSGQRNNDDLWIVSRDGRFHRQLTSGLIVSDDPCWSPSGASLAIVATTSTERWHGDDAGLWIVSLDDVAARQVLTGGVASPRTGGGLAWSTDGSALHCLRHDFGDTNLTSVRVSDGVQTRVTALQGDVSDFRLTPSGASVALVSSTQTSPPEVSILSAAGGLPVPVTSAASRLSGPLVNPVRMPFESWDGVFCDAYLYLPPGFTGSRPLPALVQAHGGGTNSHGNGWHPVEQFLACCGFVVFAVEYRGSSGYGRPFAGLSHANWGAPQAVDLVAAATFLRERSYVGKVGVYGGSYGGYLTLHALVEAPDAFDAGADLYGITNRLDYFDRSDRVGRLFVSRDYGGRTPADAPDYYLRASTYHRLDAIRAPLLVLHGADDTRVPAVQSEAVVAALRANSVPCEHVVYPGEGHGFRKREHRIDAYERVAGWFDRYLRAADPPSGTEPPSTNGHLKGD